MIEEKRLENGHPYLEVINAAAEARIALQGAHLFHYRRKGGKPLLWLSKAARFAPGTAIRGGVPICWPWFGSHPDRPELPQHGFARTALWRLAKVREKDPARSVLVFGLEKCARMGDMEPEGYRSMVCFETANALDDARRLVPGEEYILGVEISS
jgi:glucose-6-phosphate 1-epimerase